MSYGFGQRGKKTKIKNKTVANNAKALIGDRWLTLGHSPDKAQDFYNLVYRDLESAFPENNHYRIARYEFLRFIREYNREHAEAEYPEPSVPIILKRTPPVIRHTWFEHGKDTKQLALQAIEHWEKTDKYSLEETLGWLIFSAAIGGLNDQQALLSLIKSVLGRQDLSLIGPDNDIICLILAVEDTNYGNDIQPDGLYRSFIYMPDPLTQIWMIRAYQFTEELSTSIDINSLLKKALKPIRTSYSIPDLLRAADYIWSLKPNVNLCPTLVRVMQGKTKTCSLSAREFARFYRHWGPVANAILYEDEPNVMLQKDKPIKANGGVTPLSKRIMSKIKNSLEGPANQRTTGLTHLLGDIEHEGARRLISWLISLTSGRKSLKNTSIFRYMSSVAHPWVSLTADLDISLLDRSDYEELYREILSLRPQESKAYDAGRLSQFHQLMRQQFNAPNAKIDYVNNQDICAAKLIGPSLFSALIQTVNSAAIMNQADKSTLTLIYTLAYRTGMRREEIMGIQLRDIEAVTLENTQVVSFSILVRANRISSIKSTSAFRRILLSALLKPDELALMQKHWYKQRRLKQDQQSSPLFTLSNSNSPVPGHVAYSVLKQAFNVIMGQHSYTFHSFRHTALSNLAVVLQGNTELIEYLTDYSSDDVERIQTGLLGSITNGSDRWHALAQLAGHITPQQTFQSYVHFAHLQAGWQLYNSNDNISFKAIEQLTGFSQSKLYRLAPSKADGQAKQVRHATKSLPLNNLLPALFSDLKSHVGSWEEVGNTMLHSKHSKTAITKNNSGKIEQKSQAQLMLSTLPGSAISPIAMDEAYFLIKQIENKLSTESVAQDYNVPLELLERWQDKAIELRSLTTRNGLARLFSQDRLENNTDGLLLPAPLNNTGLTIQAGKLFQNANMLYEKEPDKLLWFLSVFLKKTKPTRSALYFSATESDSLKKFLEIAERLLSAAHWRLGGKTPAAARAIKVKLGLNSKLSIGAQLDDDYIGIGVSLKSPDTSKKSDSNEPKGQRSSAALKYVCHMLLIAMPPDKNVPTDAFVVRVRPV